MNKKLLLAGLFLGSILSVNAQINSFETSQGYNVGTVVGQNGWGTNIPATVTNGPSLLVSTEYAAPGGTQSLKIQGNNTTYHTLGGAFSPVSVVNGPIVTLAMDVYFSSVSATGSDFQIIPQSPSQSKVAARVNFNYQGNIMILDGPPAGTLAYVDSGADFVAGQWYNFRIVVNSTANNITYYLNNALIYTGQLYGATNIEQLVLFTDNYASSAYFDNIQTISGLLSVNDLQASKLSVYPNPTTGLVNISNDNNSSLTSVSIADLNGRTVKSLKLNGETTSQINIADLSAGVYMMTISSDQGTATKKIIKN